MDLAYRTSSREGLEPIEVFNLKYRQGLISANLRDALCVVGSNLMVMTLGGDERTDDLLENWSSRYNKAWKAPKNHSSHVKHGPRWVVVSQSYSRRRLEKLLGTTIAQYVFGTTHAKSSWFRAVPFQYRKSGDEWSLGLVPIETIRLKLEQYVLEVL